MNEVECLDITNFNHVVIYMWVDSASARKFAICFRKEKKKIPLTYFKMLK